MNEPVYQMTENMLNLGVKIGEEIGMLEYTLAKERKLRLRKASKIHSVQSSCAIEANTLSEEEIYTLLEGKMVLAPQKEVTEVKNAYRVYESIEQFDPFKVDSFLEAHRLLMDNLVLNKGRFRNENVGVYDGNRVLHIGANPQFIPSLIKELFDWAEYSSLNPLIKSCIIHFEIEFIHPFEDGNGRIGRLWQSLILCKYNNVFEYLPIETLIFKHQTEYYETLNKASQNADATLFIEFMLDMILHTILDFNKEYIERNMPINFDYTLTKTEKEVLIKLMLYFNKNEIITASQAALVLNKSTTNTRKYLSRFVSSELLIAEGKNKGRIYMLNKEVFDFS